MNWKSWLWSSTLVLAVACGGKPITKAECFTAGNETFGQEQCSAFGADAGCDTSVAHVLADGGTTCGFTSCSVNPSCRW